MFLFSHNYNLKMIRKTLTFVKNMKGVKEMPVKNSLFSRLLAIVALLAAVAVMSFASGDAQKPPKPPRGYPNLTLLKAAYFVKLLKLVDVKPEIPENVLEFKDIEYKRVGDRSLKLDIYRRKDIDRPKPLLVFIHGGAWKTGKKEDYLRYLVDFAQRGYITATLSYRLTKEARFPAQVQDVMCGVRWLKAHAEEYFINPERVAVIGGSAGGHLAMMIGYASDVPELEGPCQADTVSSRVQAVVNLYGPVDLTTDIAIERASVKQLIGKTFKEAPELYAEASPITYITPDDPPTLIFHGTLDDIVPISQSDTLKVRLDEAGIPNEYHRLKGWPHTMDLAKSVNEYCQYYMNAFFERYLHLVPGAAGNAIKTSEKADDCH